MQTDKKPFYKTMMFWQILVAGLLVLALVIGMVILLLGKPAKKPQEEKPSVPGVLETMPEETFPPLPVNPYRSGDFDYGGEHNYLFCNAGKSTLGIDVSVWQGSIDWQQVKDAGVEFVMIRAGYRGTHQGNIEADTMAQKNYEGAVAAGLKVGAYFFSQAISPEEALEEADFLLEQVKQWQVDMPLVFDWEYVERDARTAKVDARTLTDAAKAFCNRIRSAGYTPMLYFNADQSENRIYLPELADYDFWLSLYTAPLMEYPHRIQMWQYTDQGSVPGISGQVDMNLLFTYE